MASTGLELVTQKLPSFIKEPEAEGINEIKTVLFAAVLFLPVRESFSLCFTSRKLNLWLNMELVLHLLILLE